MSLGKKAAEKTQQKNWELMHNLFVGPRQAAGEGIISMKIFHSGYRCINKHYSIQYH